MSCEKAKKRASYLVRFGYLGSHFHGLQPNKGLKTAGGALAELLLENGGCAPKALQFSARTDAGVHALENFATFWFPRPFDHEAFIRGLQRANKGQLLYVDAKAVRFDTHARANARGKLYRYVIEDEAQIMDSPFAWTIAPRLDIQAMHQAAQYLVGSHEFDAFRHGGCTAKSTLKTISRISVCQIPTSRFNPRQIHIDIEGSAFLRRMVRIIAGTLAEVGAGLRQPEELQAILASKERRRAGPSAPACGLTLMRVGFELPNPTI